MGDNNPSSQSPLTPGPVENHRGRETGILVYPVYSRRSKGLSLGINLFPDCKVCSFDCPYCEVFPFQTETHFSLDRMEEELVTMLRWAGEEGILVRDISFSGNGEPTLSKHFPQALEVAGRIRDREARGADLVLITNGTGLLDGQTFEVLRQAATGPIGLSIWLKLDAGTADWYERMSRSPIPFTALISRIRDFVSQAPVILQTMLCQVNGMAPPAEEAAAWIALVRELAALGNIRGIQLYGKARPAPEDPLAEALGPEYLENRAAALGKVLGDAIPVEVFL